MISPLNPKEIYLQPGDYYFAGRDTRISTVLGSCVSIIFWHPQLLVGGMCHYMLPERDIECRESDGAALDGRYADEAITLMQKKMAVVGAPLKEYQVKLFGGGNMFPGANKNRCIQIGTLNVQAARRLAQQHGFTCMAEQLGGIGYREVIFEVWSGEVLVKHCVMLPILEHELTNGKLR
jgi:chemotaxis protein CheD